MRSMQALDLRLQGYRFWAIAQALGYSSAKSAWRAWRRALDEYTAHENYTERRRAEGGRPHYPRLTQDDLDRVLAAHAEDRQLRDHQLASVRRRMRRSGFDPVDPLDDADSSDWAAPQP
jgi:hypothetical protein